MFFIEDGVEELRAAMDTEQDEVEEKRRRKRKKEGKRKKNTAREKRMYSEINLQTKLDTMHITLRHHHLRLINTDKFITKIYENESRAANDEKSSKKAKSEDIFCRMSKYSFGESITYWDAKHHRYAASKYADLRDELLSNTIYPLSSALYATIKDRAISFLATQKGKRLCALREHDWMKKWKILKNSCITVDHIIALLCYVNVTALRRVFKLHGFVRQAKGSKNKDNKIRYEQRDVLLTRHREI